jgi:hypothetical protein
MTTMTSNDQSAPLKLQFARQLYDRCLERHGEDHEQTRLVLSFIAALEDRDALVAARATTPPPFSSVLAEAHPYSVSGGSKAA